MSEKQSTTSYGEQAAADFINEALTREGPGAAMAHRAIQVLTGSYSHKGLPNMNGLEVSKKNLAAALDSHPDAPIRPATLAENAQGFYEATMACWNETADMDGLSEATRNVLPVAEAFVATYNSVKPVRPSDEDGNARLYNAVVGLLQHSDL
ncbi:MAG: hypothetical protein Q4F02_04005 [Candidatus Saccharibacteria bacterium]|nr:hypothetical protein [Candidatus Saccharibacteria bacterium]